MPAASTTRPAVFAPEAPEPPLLLGRPPPAPTQIRRRQAEIPNNSSAQCISEFGELSIACAPYALKRTKTADLGPIGIDPVFNEKSSLYRPDLANAPEMVRPPAHRGGSQCASMRRARHCL